MPRGPCPGSSERRRRRIRLWTPCGSWRNRLTMMSLGMIMTMTTPTPSLAAPPGTALGHAAHDWRRVSAPIASNRSWCHSIFFWIRCLFLGIAEREKYPFSRGISMSCRKLDMLWGGNSTPMPPPHLARTPLPVLNPPRENFRPLYARQQHLATPDTHLMCPFQTLQIVFARSQLKLLGRDFLSRAILSNKTS